MKKIKKKKIITHINPNCKNSKYCLPHNETEEVRYDWDKINKDLENSEIEKNN